MVKIHFELEIWSRSMKIDKLGGKCIGSLTQNAKYAQLAEFWETVKNDSWILLPTNSDHPNHRQHKYLFAITNWMASSKFSIWESTSHVRGPPFPGLPWPASPTWNPIPVFTLMLLQIAILLSSGTGLGPTSYQGTMSSSSKLSILTQIRCCTASNTSNPVAQTFLEPQGSVWQWIQLYLASSSIELWQPLKGTSSRPSSGGR